jgi:hypothetical protein
MTSSPPLSDLDKSSSLPQWTRVWAGPTLGWSWVPVQPLLRIGTPGPFAVLPGMYVLLVTTLAAQFVINLPSVVSWMKSLPSQGQVFPGTFENALWIKDMTGNAPANNIVINPNGPDTIDALVATSFKIIQARQLLRLYPLPDLSGWFSG